MLMTVIGVVPLYWLNWSLYATGCQILVFLMVACLHTTMCMTWCRILRCRIFYYFICTFFLHNVHIVRWFIIQYLCGFFGCFSLSLSCLSATSYWWNKVYNNKIISRVYLLWHINLWTRLTFYFHYISFYCIILLYQNVLIQTLAAIWNKTSVDCLIDCLIDRSLNVA